MRHRKSRSRLKNRAQIAQNKPLIWRWGQDRDQDWLIRWWSRPITGPYMGRSTFIITSWYQVEHTYHFPRTTKMYLDKLQGTHWRILILVIGSCNHNSKEQLKVMKWIIGTMWRSYYKWLHWYHLISCMLTEECMDHLAGTVGPVSDHIMKAIQNVQVIFSIPPGC